MSKKLRPVLLGLEPEVEEQAMDRSPGALAHDEVQVGEGAQGRLRTRAPEAARA